MGNEATKVDIRKGPPYSIKRVGIVFIFLLLLVFLVFFCWYYNLACYMSARTHIDPKDIPVGFVILGNTEQPTENIALCRFCSVYGSFTPLLLLVMLVITLVMYWASKKWVDKKELATDLSIAFAGGLIAGILVYIIVLFGKWISFNGGIFPR